MFRTPFNLSYLDLRDQLLTWGSGLYSNGKDVVTSLDPKSSAVGAAAGVVGALAVAALVKWGYNKYAASKQTAAQTEPFTTQAQKYTVTWTQTYPRRRVWTMVLEVSPQGSTMSHHSVAPVKTSPAA